MANRAEENRELIRLFRGRFGRPPEVAASAPGRINLIGEHTDYNEGFVLPIAIERRTTIAAAWSRDPSRSTLVAVDLGQEVVVDLRKALKPIPRGHADFFANYLLGVVEQFRRIDRAIPNLDLLVRSTVPLGAGLSSSASVEVAMATLIEFVTRRPLEPLEKAFLCQRAEHEFPGTPCGIMDMYASVMAQRGHALLIDCRTYESTHIPLPESDAMTLLVVETGVKHDLAAGEYAARRASCEAAAKTLGASTLRDATMAMLDEAKSRGEISEVEECRAAHVVMENVRTLRAANALRNGHLEDFCNAMFESHTSLRTLYEVSCPELDLIVDEAHALREHTGDALLGARMTGGGFGGCAIVFCRTAAADAIATVIRARFKEAFGRKPLIFRTAAADGAARIEV